jgi:hypothetical protein
MGRRGWLIGLCLYGLAASVDFAYHLMTDVLPGAGRTVNYAELPVAYSAALFWPLDLVGMALLSTK